MKLGFDAKRAFSNRTGLGHYSRTLISSLANLYSNDQFFLFTPKKTSLFNSSSFDNIFTITPNKFPATILPAVWRSSWIKKDLVNWGIEIYHGLSHEIPYGIAKTSIKTVVTIHDLIFERYPDQYNPIDVFIYRKKFRYACEYADVVVAISEQTKRDIIDFYQIDEAKIKVVYQSCNPAFKQSFSAIQLKSIQSKYNLPNNFLLYVGSVIERKNLMLIVEAISLLKASEQMPVVIIGDGGRYKQIVKQRIAALQLDHLFIWLSETPAAESNDFKNATDFPAIYNLATAMIYPSIFEGFGIPVLEALMAGLPTITSNLSCLPETGGDAACYINPSKPEALAEAICKVVSDTTLRERMIKQGYAHSSQFSPEICAQNMMQLYANLLNRS